MGLLECPLKCGQCFPNSTTLKKHLESHLTNVKCPYCFLLIDNIHSLPSHLDDCIISKKEEEDQEDETDHTAAEEDLEYVTEVISVLPDDDNFNAGIIKQETQNDNPPDPIMVFNINPTDDPLDKKPIELNKTSLETIDIKGLNTSLVKINNAAQENIDNTALSDETESETETQEIEAQENEILEEDVNIKFEDITTEEVTDEQAQEYDMNPAVDKTGEQEIEAEKEENVYHCSSCNAHFTDVKQHLAEFHTNQQVYLQVPEKDGTNGKKVFVKKDGTSDSDYDGEMDLENLPSAANDNKDQAIWVSWSDDFYLSTRNLLNSGFESSEDFSYVIRPKKKNARVEDLSPFYMEDQYGDKFFSVPVDTAIDYYEASNGRCGPKRFVGNFTRVFIGKVFKPRTKQRQNVYERVISTYQLSLTHILFSKMPPEHFLPVIVQINPRHGNDEGVKYKVCWRCNFCEREMDMWTDHDCEDVFTGDGEERISYEGEESTMSQDNEEFDESEDPSYINKENTGVETYVVNQGEGYKKITKVKPTKKNNEITKHMCKKCNIIFFKDSYFFEHVKEKHAIPVQKKATAEPLDKGEQLVMGKYYCQPCKLMFANERWLEIHHQTDHRHQPGYKPLPEALNNIRPKAPAPDRSERTCHDCKGILFETIAWYKYHRKIKHGETFDASELPPVTDRERLKPRKQNTTKKGGFQGGVHLKFEPDMEPDEDELLPDDGTPLDPKLLRTCTLCAKVKNSISSLRKHLRDIHQDTSIMTEEEEEKVNNKDTEDLIETLDGVLKDEIHEPDDATETTEGLYDIDENSAITRRKPSRPVLYKFKHDGLALEDVQKRYIEHHVLELDAHSKQCGICSEDDFETQPKLLKHLETNHLAEVCVESFYLIKKLRQRELQRKSRRVEILDANTLSDEVRAKVTEVMEAEDDKEREPVLIEIELMGEQTGTETESAIENLVSEETQDADDSTLNDSTGQPPAKKCKFEIIKPDDLTPTVRKRIDEQAKALKIDTPVYIRNLGTNYEETTEKQSFGPKIQDRTNKVTVQILDYLNFREKLQERVNRRLQDTQEKLNKRAVALQERELNRLEIKINSKIAKENYRIARENANIMAGQDSKEGIINKKITTSRNFAVTDFNGDVATSCMTCRVSFTTERRMERHREVFHKNCSECAVCSLLIQDQAMETHMKGHEASNTIEFTCKECNNSFESEEHLGYHKLVHQNKVVVIQKQRCEHCYAEFFDTDMLKNHLKIHGTRRIYSCNFCHKHFFVLAEKVVHERIHTGVKPYACDQCGKAFRKKFSLTVHVRHVHLKEKRYECDLCNNKFVTHSSLMVHKQRHDSTPRYKCKLCPKLFTNTGTRANHIRRFHYGTVEYVCKVCTRVFLSMAALRRHYAKHETLKYPCTYCPQEYGRSLYLTKHLKEAHDITDVTVK